MWISSYGSCILSRPGSDRLTLVVLRLCAVVAAAIVLMITAFVVIESLPALQRIGLGRFFTDTAWLPSARATDGQFRLAPMLVGSVLVTAGALAIAVPAGLLSALFCQFYGPPGFATNYRRVLEILAGIPSVVYGFWGLVVLVPWVAQVKPPGTSLLSGVLVLSIMILPTIALTAESAIANVPEEFLRGAAAMGLSRWGAICGVVIPSARRGLITGIILATGRAIGETMAVLMVCGNVVQTPDSLFSPMRTLTANIALEMAYAMGDHRSALFVCGLVLLVLVAGLVVWAESIDKESAYA